MPDEPNIHHLLVIDDDPVMRDLLEAVLSLAGFQPTLVSSGDEALAIIRGGSGHPVDAVLMDLHMPGLEGAPLAEALREALGPGPLLLGMSATTPEAGLRASLDNFLAKPFDPESFGSALREAQGHSLDLPLGQSAPVQQAPPPPLDESIYASLSKVIPSPQLEQLYEMTLTDIARRHSRILEAADAGDLETVRREAHSVKGSCGMVGALELQEIAAKVELATTLDAAREARFSEGIEHLRRMLNAKQQP